MSVAGRTPLGRPRPVCEAVIGQAAGCFSLPFALLSPSLPSLSLPVSFPPSPLPSQLSFTFPFPLNFPFPGSSFPLPYPSLSLSSLPELLPLPTFPSLPPFTTNPLSVALSSHKFSSPVPGTGCPQATSLQDTSWGLPCTPFSYLFVSTLFSSHLFFFLCFLFSAR